MKEAFWAYFLVVLGLFIIIVLLLIQRMTVTTEEDFYLGREALEASMIDAVDYGTYRTSGKLVMSKEKFVEVFIRRFAESVTNNKTYQLDFYDISEEPPKASVRIRTTSGTTEIDSNSFVIGLDTNVSGILETIYGLEGGDGNTNKVDPTPDPDDPDNPDDPDDPTPDPSGNITVTRYTIRDDGYYLNESLTGTQKTLKKCSIVTITYSKDKTIESVCKNSYCKAKSKGSTIYIDRTGLSNKLPTSCSSVPYVGSWKEQYYSIGYARYSSGKMTFTYKIKLNKTKNGDSAYTAKSCSTSNAMAMSSVNDVIAYHENKAGNDMEMVGSDGSGDVTCGSDAYIWAHSATSANLSVTTSCAIEGNYAVITVTDNIHTLIDKRKVVSKADGCTYVQGGETIEGIYFLPIKYWVTFNY